MTDRCFGPYPGFAIVGGGNISGLYGVNDGLPGAQGTGLRHCFLGDYRHDLIHTATTLLRYPGGQVEYGNRYDDGLSHPEYLNPTTVFNRDGYAWGSTFGPGEGRPRRTEVVTAAGAAVLSFECTVEGPFEGDVCALVVFRGFPDATCRLVSDGAIWEGPEGKALRVTIPEGAPIASVVADSPSGFLYRTVQVLQTFASTSYEVRSDQPIGMVAGRHVSLAAGESYVFRWYLGDVSAAPSDERAFWESWYKEGTELAVTYPEILQWYRANLAAVRGAVINGFVPADMTGQYFAQGSPSYYARDSLMIARSLLLSGHYPEFESIVRYLAKRAVKRDGEFFQRYSAVGEPSEGQHNGVPHQLDSQGYFVWNVVEYYRRTGIWLVPFSQIVQTLDVLEQCMGPTGMVGPEGGVNEGVYGPAYITSSNMFIYGGLLAGITAAEVHGKRDVLERWRKLADRIREGIESAWDDHYGRYYYGYVTYDAQPVRQYDTPQYFGPLYGFPLTDRIRRNDEFLRRQAAFFGEGIGYSEQEYHHGPWVFNTAACTEFQVLVGNHTKYWTRLRWLMNHSNQYGLMPEAIDATDESRCFVNPLVWGCAEVVAAIAMGHRGSGVER